MSRTDAELLALVYRRSAAIRAKRYGVTVAAVALAIVAVSSSNAWEDEDSGLETFDERRDTSTTVVETTIPLGSPDQVVEVPSGDGLVTGATSTTVPADPTPAAPIPQVVAFAGQDGNDWFDGNDGIFVQSPSGGSARRIAELGFDVEASPDGRFVTFARYDSGANAIFVADIATGDEQQITSWQPTSHSPRWSPDGSRIAFEGTIVTQSGLGPVVTTQTSREVVQVVGRDGQGLTEITNGVRPQWSPDGRHLAFLRDQTIVVRHLATGREVAVDGPPVVLDYSWAPDSLRLALIGGDVEEEFALPRRLYVTGRDGRAAKVVDAGGLVSETVRWSPVADELAVVGASGDSNEIRVVPLDGSTVRRIAGDRPSWSRDGASLAFCRSGGLRVIGRDGRGERLLYSTDPCTGGSWTVTR